MHEPGSRGILHVHQLGGFIDSYHLMLRWYQRRNAQHATTFTVVKGVLAKVGFWET